MSTQNTQNASASAVNKGAGETQLAAPAADSIPVTEAAANVKAAVTAERDRITGIFALEGAKDKFAMCLEAVKLGLEVDQAKGLLAAAPEAVKKAEGSGLDAAMASVSNPDIGPDADGEGDETQALINSIVAAGQKPAPALAS